MKHGPAFVFLPSFFLLLFGTAVAAAQVIDENGDTLYLKMSTKPDKVATARQLNGTPVVSLQLTSDKTAPAKGAVVLPSQVQGAEEITYPQSAFEERVEGTVRLKVLFNEKGEVVQSETLDNGGDARLLHATVSGLNRSRFTPGTIDGENAEMGVVVTADFRIEVKDLTPSGSVKNADAPAAKRTIVTLEDFESIPEDEEQDTTVAYPEFFPDAVPPQYDSEELVSHLVYPKEAQQAGLEGRVYLKVAIDKTGKVVKVSVVHRSGIDSDIFDEAAIEAVRKTRFTPANQAGYPVAMAVTIPITFQLAE